MKFGVDDFAEWHSGMRLPRNGSYTTISRLAVRELFSSKSGLRGYPMIETASALSPPFSQPTHTGMLYGFWYPAMLARDLKAGQIRATTLLNLPIAIGKDAQARAFALADLCPHRAMPLSFGRVCGSEVECCYHGWKFDAHSGQCRAIPSLADGANVKVDRIFAKGYACAERDGYIWVYVPDPEARLTNDREQEPPPVPQLPVFSERYRMTHVAAEFPSDVDQSVLGL